MELDRQERDEIIPWILEKLAKGEKPKYYPYAEDLNSDSNVSPFKCGACRGTTTVGADGDLYPCHRFVGMQAWKIGDIGNGPDYERCQAILARLSIHHRRELRIMLAVGAMQGSVSMGDCSIRWHLS